MHYIASHAYSQICTPWTITGFLLSPFMVTTPHCTAIRWFMNLGSENINILWITIGSFGISYFKKYI